MTTQQQTETPGLTIGPPAPEAPVAAEEEVFVEPTPEETQQSPYERAQGAPRPESGMAPDPRVQALVGQLAQLQQQQAYQTLQQQAAEFTQQLVAAGWDQAQAEAETSRQVKTYMLEQAVQAQHAQIQAHWKQRVANFFSQTYGVDTDILMNAPDGPSMKNLAERLSGTNQRLQQYDQRLGSLERNQAIPQRYDSNRGSGRGVPVTSQNIDVLYNQGRVSDAVYRHFLNTGQIRRL